MVNHKDRQRIRELTEENGVLNCRQVCRLLNGRGKNEYRYCYFTFKEKPKGTKGMGCRHVTGRRCKYIFSTVHGLIMRMIKAGILQTDKRRFWDHGGIGRDTFRFIFVDFNEFERQILSQTLIPYTSKD